MAPCTGSGGVTGGADPNRGLPGPRRPSPTSPSALRPGRVCRRWYLAGLRAVDPPKAVPTIPQNSKPARARNSRPARPGLSRDAIAAKALEIIDADGLEAMTLRTLAAALDVYPTAIYWHLPSRDAVLSEVVRLVLSDVVPPWPETLSWQDFLRRLMHNIRAAVRAHPNVASVLGAHTVANMTADLRLVEAVLAVVLAAGHRGAAAADAYNCTVAGLTGFVTQEFASLPDEPARWQAFVRDRLRSEEVARYPLLAAHMPALMNRSFILRWDSGAVAPLDSSFAMFVETVVRGLERGKGGG